MKQTAVEWYVQKFEELLLKLDFNEISDEEYLEEKEHIVIIAKEIEKQHIIDAFKSGDCNGTFETISGEQYYNDKFK